TLPLIHLLRAAPERLATRARQVLTAADNHRRESLKPLLAEAGSLEYARTRALRLTEQARRELACLPASACRAILEGVTDRVARRLDEGARRRLDSLPLFGRHLSDERFRRLQGVGRFRLNMRWQFGQIIATSLLRPRQVARHAALAQPRVQPQHGPRPQPRHR